MEEVTRSRYENGNCGVYSGPSAPLPTTALPVQGAVPASPDEERTRRGHWPRLVWPSAVPLPTSQRWGHSCLLSGLKPGEEDCGELRTLPAEPPGLREAQRLRTGLGFLYEVRKTFWN